MSLRHDIQTQYQRHGSRHILPFIGSAYELSDDSFRVLSLGFNAYVSDGDWPDDENELQDWYVGWWRDASWGQSPKFFSRVYEECRHLANELTSSPLFVGHWFDSNPRTKSGIYGTNAIKVFTEEHLKTSNMLSQEDFQEHMPTWHAELDILAKYRRLPHLIVVFGQAIWDYAWRAFYPYDAATFPDYSYLKIEEYQTCGDEGSPCYHHVNHVVLRTEIGRQNLLLVRLHHPSARTVPRRDSAWLLSQPDFRELAQLRHQRG